MPRGEPIWSADNATAASKCIALRKWWDLLCSLGPKYGYYPNASKSYLIVSEASRVFHDTNVIITTRGARYLGAALGSTEFIHEFVKLKISTWCEEVEKIANIASSQPHAAFAAYIHGMQGKWSFLQCTVNSISELLKPLEECVRAKLIPAISGRPSCSNLERQLLSLPSKMGKAPTQPP